MTFDTNAAPFSGFLDLLQFGSYFDSFEFETILDEKKLEWKYGLKLAVERRFRSGSLVEAKLRVKMRTRRDNLVEAKLRVKMQTWSNSLVPENDNLVLGTQFRRGDSECNMS